MTDTLMNPADPPARQNEKLLQIVEVLMRRVEQDTDDSGAAYAQFQRAVMLEDEVRQRTSELEHALDLLNESNGLLAEATREAQAARQNLADAIETVQEGFALFDADDTMIMCNSRFGMHMADIHGALVPGLSFADYVGLVSRSSQLALPKNDTPESWAGRRMRRHDDNHVMFNVRLSGDRWVQVSEHRTRDGGTVILQTDVTDIIRLEREERGKLLDNQARMIRATLEHLNQGVCIFDAQGRLVDWNRRLGRLLEIPVGRVQIGSSFDTLVLRLSAEMHFSGTVSTEALTAWAGSQYRREPLSFELNRGDDLILAVFAQEMPDRGFVMSFTDITTERHAMRAIREANETLEQRVHDRTTELADALRRAERANASRSRFVAAASHDLLQPLSAAKLYLASISDEALADTARRTLEKAHNALTSVESILDALLDISRLESGHAAVDVKPVDLGALLSRLHEDFAPIAARKGLKLEFSGSAAVVNSDALYLRRILQNLVSNAIRYTKDGSVRVETERDGAHIYVRVIDTGIGIPEDEQSNVFREFHRLNAQASASDGMGLGLTIVERACALLEHALELRSTVGQGTCFTISLPIVNPDAPYTAAPSAQRLTPLVVPTDGIVCLVENDAEFRAATCQLLEKWGFDVIDVESGESALSLLDEIDIVPDVFLVDYQLGAGMSGLDLIKRLQSRHGRLSARIITANRSPEIVQRCAAASVGVLYKPVKFEELADFLLADA
ncbi:Autoinducer 2 sensor kinase/phosphatase LuxQ [Defluviimonas aquaemixtae]|uniref:histidine kinase n=1 Tax=Albidovulum aquaemixtae TaxID=1542388 RepID=A0A2R8B3T0_9RHOB|nr:PAS-domain containing protein [Defluviimonas aquaemixtae]SPH17242.1 Autoinducer 2 sensor kinase/phosphatase LuxQ [Defluviimonas aquaemixtae]